MFQRIARSLMFAISLFLVFSEPTLVIGEPLESKSIKGSSRIPQNWAMVSITFQNKERFAIGELSQECGNCVIHSCPFGNWGVNSNFGSIQDSNQFRGWNTNAEWNTCTQDQWEAPNCAYYDYASCTQQYASGIYPYAGTTICYPLTGAHQNDGCTYLNNKTLTFSGNYMSVYELDPFDDDEFIQTLNYPNLQKTYTGCNFSSCPSQASPWKSVSSYQPSGGGQIIDAQIRFLVVDCEAVTQCP